MFTKSSMTTTWHSSHHTLATGSHQIQIQIRIQFFWDWFWTFNPSGTSKISLPTTLKSSQSSQTVWLRWVCHSGENNNIYILLYRSLNHLILIFAMSRINSCANNEFLWLPSGNPGWSLAFNPGLAGCACLHDHTKVIIINNHVIVYISQIHHHVNHTEKGFESPDSTNHKRMNCWNFGKGIWTYCFYEILDWDGRSREKSEGNARDNLRLTLLLLAGKTPTNWSSGTSRAPKSGSTHSPGAPK